MASKEIILNNVNVNECEFYGYDGICKLYSGSVCSKDCSNYPNCNYKQLKRKEQECEELRKQLDKYLNQEEEEIRQLNNDNKLDEILSAISKANAQIEKESNYKQALDKIEKFCTVYSADHDAYETVYKDILAFINKAKGGE